MEHLPSKYTNAHRAAAPTFRIHIEYCFNVHIIIVIGINVVDNLNSV
jgi:hypothetical protein